MAFAISEKNSRKKYFGKFFNPQKGVLGCIYQNMSGTNN